MTPFSDTLASLCSREFIAAKNDPDRLAEMVERIAHALSWTIACISMGDPGKAQTLLMGCEQYLYEGATALSGVGLKLGGGK